MEALLAPVKKNTVQEYFDKYPPEIQTMILKPAAERTPYETMMWAKAKPYLEMSDDDKTGEAAQG